jgi:hypothetical protein
VTKRNELAIPADLLIWEELVDWRAKIERIVRPDLKRLLRSGFQRQRPTQPYLDSFGWLDEYMSRERLDDACDQLAVPLGTLRCRAYHCCRPTRDLISIMASSRSTL